MKGIWGDEKRKQLIPARGAEVEAKQKRREKAKTQMADDRCQMTKGEGSAKERFDFVFSHEQWSLDAR